VLAVPAPEDAPDLYDPAYVRDLFDAMAGSYERVNEITSFGFSRRWRRQAVAWLGCRPGDTVLDAMTGMGEGWRHLAPRLGERGCIVAVDLSPGMLRHARRRTRQVRGPAIEVREGDALETGLPDASMDAVLCLFGVKTLSPDQRHRFAREIHRLLRPGGRYALIEVSVPRWALLRMAYLAYLRHAIPVLGRLLLGDPEDYRMLAAYTMRFRDCRAMAEALRAAGLEAEATDAFFGCATGVRGRRPPG
jgi:demethylmenaquinone methyltransferase/2-methoxy-6-polyprenyl-1,4-benzoquinol methylase